MTQALVDYNTSVITEYEALIRTTYEELSSLRKRIDDLSNKNTAEIKDLDDLDRQIQFLRVGLSDPQLTAADVQANAEQLREQLIERRHVAARIESDTFSKHIVETKLLAHSEALTNYERTLLECKNEKENAVRHAGIHAGWFTVDTNDEMTLWVDKSKTLLQEISNTPPAAADPDSDEAAQRALIKLAKARIEADIPEILQNHSISRTAKRVENHLVGEREMLIEIEDAQSDYVTAHNADDGQRAGTHVSYTRSESALQEIVLGAKPRVLGSLNLLQRVIDTPPLTIAEKARVNSVDVALAVDDDALITEAAVSDAMKSANDSSRAYELAVLNALIEKPTKDPDNDVDVQSAKTIRDTAMGNLADAETLHTVEHRARIDLWEVALPDSMWSAFADYQSALSQLVSVADVQFTDLKTAFTLSESSHIDALGKVESNRQVGFVTDVYIKFAQGKAKSNLGQLQSQRDSTLRGDA